MYDTRVEILPRGIVNLIRVFMSNSILFLCVDFDALSSLLVFLCLLARTTRPYLNRTCSTHV